MTETFALRDVHNFRDLGGLETVDGGRTHYGVLFRSDSFHEAGQDDIDHLARTVGIRCIVDLRAAREVDADGRNPRWPDTVAYHHFPLAGGPGGAIEGAPSGERLALRYLEYLRDCADSVIGAVRAVVEAGGRPAVLHCRAGKDRTGVVVALILAAVGVRPEAVAADYQLTTEGMKKIMERLRASPTYAANVRRLPAEMYSSDAPTMLAFLGLLQKEYGGAADYLLSHGVDQATLDRLDAILVQRTTEV